MPETFLLELLLLDHPWLTAADLAAYTSREEAAVAAELQDRSIDFYAFEHPADKCPRFALSWSAQRALQRALETPFYHPRRLIGAALLANHLAPLRTQLARLPGVGGPGRFRSPVLPGRKDQFFDAGLQLDGGGQLLLTSKPALAGRSWYSTIFNAWEKWNIRQSFPGKLLFWNPDKDSAFLAGLIAFRKISFQEVFWYSGDALVDFLQINFSGPGNSTKRAGIKSLDFCRRGPASRYTKLQDWIAGEGNGKKSYAARLRLLNGALQLNSDELKALHLVAQFPYLQDRTLKRIEPRLNGTTNAFSSLQKNGWIQTGREDRRVITEPGLDVLSGMAGMNREDLDRTLGWPQRLETFQYQHAHTTGIEAWVRRLAENIRVLNWRFFQTRERYFRINVPEMPSLRYLDIYPDSEIRIQVTKNQICAFWLEYDRGSRWGKSLYDQLRKYFLIRYAAFGPPIPPLVLLVQVSSGNPSSRIKYLVGRLRALQQEFPFSSFSCLIGPDTEDNHSFRILSRKGIGQKSFSLTDGLLQLQKQLVLARRLEDLGLEKAVGETPTAEKNNSFRIS